MNLTISDEQKMVADSASDFAEKLREAHRETEKNGLPDDFVATYKELSFLAMDWPEAHGGFAMGFRTKVMALEELAYGDAAATLALDRVSWVCSPLLSVEATAGNTAEAIQSGGEGFTPCFHIDLDERLDIDGDSVKGTIGYLPSNSCDGLFILRDNRVLYLTEGFEVEPTLVGALDALGGLKATVDGTAQWSVDLDLQDAVMLTGMSRLYLSAVLIGLMRASFDATKEFTLQRVTFGKKVAHHQAVAFMISDMAIAIAAARMLVWQAADGLDDGDGNPNDLQQAFIHACESALLVTDHGVQLHGSSGYVEDFPVEKWMREGRAITLLSGGEDGARVDAQATLIRTLEATA